MLRPDRLLPQSRDGLERHRGTLLERAHYESLLRAEHDVIRVAREHWNHPGAWLAHWRGDELVAAGGEVCLVMPACEGTALGRLPRREQREWIPAMLPALWQALSHCPHGDLDVDDLLIDPSGRFFRILDPGVCIDGPSYEKLRGADFSSTLFTTNAAHYPLLLPEHGPDPPTLRAPYAGLLAHLLKIYETHGPDAPSPLKRTDHSGDGASPAAADLIALGAMYAFTLTGVPLHELLALNRPFWSGRSGYRRGEHFESADRLVEEIESGGLFGPCGPPVPPGRKPNSCDRLVALRIDSKEDLRRL